MSLDLPIYRDPQKITVRFGVTRDLSPGNRNLLEERAAAVDQLPEHGLAIYRLGRDEAEQAVESLNRERSVAQAAPVLHHPRATDDIYVTGRFVVQFLPDVTRARIDQLNGEHGVTIVEELGYAENGFLLSAPSDLDGLGALHTANAYRETGLTRFAHPDLITRRHRRATPPPGSGAGIGRSARAVRDADYVSRQWHLAAAGVFDAWSIGSGSPDITIAVLDDGIDVSHPEFSGKIGPQFDFATRTTDASPKSAFNRHGTACSGVATAKGLRAAGAAPGCTLMPVRFPDFLGSADEARMFQWTADNGADVISCSWGPNDGSGSLQPLPGSTEAALAYCAELGRSGKGIPICWAAGNGNESVDLDGYASSPHVIAVAASTDRERRAWYSDHGAAIWVCAPSSGAASLGEKAIITADRSGIAGYNDGTEGIDLNYTNSFGGTSAAAPLVAGIVALMFSANPSLSADQVRAILRNTARRIGTGYEHDSHSPEYGYGQVNALAAVQASRSAAPLTSHRAPSIASAESVLRSGTPPVFDLTLGDGPDRWYYAVEVATAPEMFNRAAHEVDRTPHNFYGSWADSSFLQTARYTLPNAVWNRLHHADVLYFRAWFSLSPTEWQGAVTTTKDAAFATAPSIEILPDLQERSLPDSPISERDDVAARRFRPTVRVPTRYVDPDEELWRRL
ncbi:S8 family serine peptidase [Streptomyces sp. NPDC056656]|uniref:S8 family peptidase n=1 Tax=Streptomyces sp. NPDC056656 TaxID=3345895 RepID=UPI00367E35C6